MQGFLDDLRESIVQDLGYGFGEVGSGRGVWGAVEEGSGVDGIA